MASLPPAALKGYPYQAIIDYSPSPSKKPFVLSLPRGEQGTVLGEELQDGWILVSGKDGKQGYVPRWAIHVGTTRKVGDRAFVHDLPTSLRPGFRPSTVPGDSLFEKAIRGLAVAFKVHLPDMPFLSQAMKDMLNDDVVRDAYVQQYLRDINPKYFEIANNPNWKVSDFHDSIPAVDPSERRSGYYARITSAFRRPDLQQRQPEYYIGSTGDFWERLKSHQMPPPATTNAAQLSVLATRNCDMYPLFFTTGDQLYRDFCEQLTISSNGSYLADLKLPPKTVLDTTTVQDVVNLYGRGERSRIINSIATPLFEQIGYIPISERPGFGVSAALNYASPLAETDASLSKVLWVRTVHDGIKHVFYRAYPTAFGENKNLLLKLGHRYDRSLGTRGLTIAHPGGPSPPPGAEIFVVCEIMLHGPHPTSWARLQDVGTYSDWHLANRLGIRIEWLEDDQWMTMICQAAQHRLHSFAQSDDPGCVERYATAMGMIRYLTQVTQEEPKAWFVDFGIARVKTLTWDHLSQTCTLSELAPSGKAVAPIKTKDEAQLAAEISALGARYVNEPIFGPGSPKNWRGHAAVSCDACLLMNAEARIDSRWSCTERIVDGTATGRCQNCYFRGLLCSSTPNQNFTPAMIDGLRDKRLADIKILPCALDVERLDHD